MSRKSATRMTKLLNLATDRTSKTVPRATITTPIMLKFAGDASSSSSSQLVKPSISKKLNKSSISKPLCESAVDGDTTTSISDSKKILLTQLKLIVGVGDEEEGNDARYLPGSMEIPFCPTRSHTATPLFRKEVSRERRQDRLFKSSQDDRFGQLVRMCAKKLGTNSTMQFFGKLDRETGIKEFKAMIEICIENGRNTDDEEVALEEFHRIYMIFETMRERGFRIEEVTYGPFLMFIVDKGMVDEFHLFCDSIKKENSKSLSRLAYYEMLLWLKVGDEYYIRRLIEIALANDESNFNGFIESYLVALGEADRLDEVLMLIDTLDIIKVSSKGILERIFKILGRLSLECHAKNFIRELKTEDKVGQNLSDLICSYVMSMPNIMVEDVVDKFEYLQDELKVPSSSVPYEKLIKACCDSLRVHLAIDLVYSVLECDLTIRASTINSILKACYVSGEYNLVHRINALINDHNIKSNAETFRIMNSLLVKSKDIGAAYGMSKDVER